ncbi:MAG: hypothetical protein J07HX5_01485 [halophilic archaeon J07HX5]|nr:MAG: hypothetical protein J07HX5_01485 [halophilic archaeon J07HX5]
MDTRLRLTNVSCLGVKWFERHRLSSSRNKQSSVRLRGIRLVPPVEISAENAVYEKAVGMRCSRLEAQHTEIN